MTPVNSLAQIATALIVRIRDDEPGANAAWLAGLLPEPADWFRLAFVLAAAVPDDRTWRQLTAWTTRPLPDKAPAGPKAVRQLQPHGTVAAVSRHRYRREPLCEACREAARVYERDRKRNSRKAAA